MSNQSAAPTGRTCVIAQPTFIPWIGWFDLADQADVMIILDDVQFSKQSWQQRNRLRTPEGLSYLSVPVKSAGRSHQLINDVELANEASVEKLLRSIQGYCARTPFFRDYFPGLSAAMREGAATGKLAGLNIAIIRWIMAALGIQVPLVLSSELSTCGKRGDYVAALCEEVGANRYLSPAGAEEYLREDHAAFERRHISVWLHVYAHPEYRQCFKPFEPYASVLDLIFNTGPEALAVLRSGRRPARALAPPAPGRRHVFRVDASAAIGVGHLMRCLTLAERLAQRGGEIHFITRALPDVLRAQLDVKGYGVHLLPPAAAPAGGPDSLAHAAWLGADWREDAEQTSAVLTALGGTDTLIIDHYAIDRRWEAVLRPQARQICVIDDLADRPHDCDILLDQNYFPGGAARYDGLLPAPCRRLCGPGHALLRREFVDAAATLRSRDGSIRRVLIFYGGADPGNLTGLTLDALFPCLGPDLHADVVIGGLNPHADALRARCADQPYLHLHVQTEHMAELMAAADLAFGGGGTANWERCILGLPTIVLILADNQREPTHALETAGVVLNLGEAASVRREDLSTAFDRLAADAARCREMSARARALMQSDAAPIEDLLTGDLPFIDGDVHLRPASRSDAADLLAWRNQPDVRQHSRNQNLIAPEEHARWLDGVLEAPNRHLQIGYRNDNPVGVLRLDESGDAGEVSIYLTPGAQGQGNGRALLRALEAWVRATRPQIERLVAVVLSENSASNRLFISNGYTRLPTHYEKRITR